MKSHDKDYITEGFDELLALGYKSEYVEVNHRDGSPTVIRPAFSLESCMGCGEPKGTKMTFNDHNGWDHQRVRAREAIGTQTVTVKFVNVSNYSSSYEFEEVDGKWNTVMFDKVLL